MNKVLMIISLACAIWVIYDSLAVNKSLTTTARILWVMAAVIFPILAALFYFFKEKKHLF